jgi:hypothetical protein
MKGNSHSDRRPLPPPRRPRASRESQGGATWRHALDVRVCFEPSGESSEDLRDSVLACRRLVRDSVAAVLKRVVDLRGHDPESCCRQELTGSIGDLPLFDLMQMVSMGRRSAVIDVRHGAMRGRIWCASGEIIDASSGLLEGERAVYRILGLEAGELCADFRPVARRRMIHEGTQALMLETARRKDECAELARQLGGSDGVWWVCPGASNTTLDDAAATVVEALGRGAPLERVVSGSTLGDLETLRAMHQLAERGVIARRSMLPALPAAPPAPKQTPPEGWFAPALAWLEGHPWTGAATLAFGVSVALLAVEPEFGSDALEARRGAPPSSIALSASEAGVPASYAVEVSVEPRSAALWLDGNWLAIGAVALKLLRDGRTHELRIVSPGYRSRTVLFQDRPPPPVLALEAETEREGKLESTPLPSSRAPERPESKGSRRPLDGAVEAR